MMLGRLIVLLAVALAGVLAANAFGEDPGVTTTAGPPFSPGTANIPVGGTVHWSNGARGMHNVDFDDGSFRNGDPSTTAWTAAHTFATAGAYRYHCDFHG